jgi:hypothetical protein
MNSLISWQYYGLAEDEICFVRVDHLHLVAYNEESPWV